MALVASNGQYRQGAGPSDSWHRGRLGTIVPAASLAEPRGAILLPAATGPILVSIDRLLGSPYGVG